MLLTKVIDVSDEADPLPKGYNFPPQIAASAAIDPDAPVFDSGPISRMNRPELVGMAIKRRDPADVLLMQTFIARHGLRLVGFFPQVRAGRFLCDGSADGLPRRGPRPLGAENGLTRAPPRAIVTKGGKRFVSLYEEARMRYYKLGAGEASSGSTGIVPIHRAQDEAIKRAGVYEDRLSVQSSGMSLADGKYYRLSWDSTIKGYRQAVPESQKLPKDGKLPRLCQNPGCFEEIDAKRHHNVRFHNAKCTARAKELRRLDRKNQKAGRPIHYRNELGSAPDLTNDINQLEAGVTSPHISRGIVSQDCPAEVAVYQH